jgi:hypothetical protein
MNIAMQKSLSVAATTTVANVLTGERYERVPFAGAIGGLYCAGSALGLTAELNVGGTSITPPTTVNAGAHLPVIPDDTLIEGWEAVRGQLIQLTVVNTTGGALTFYWKIVLVEAQVTVR